MNSKSINKVLFAFNLALGAAIIFLVSRNSQAPPETMEHPSVASNESLPVASAPRPRPYATESDWRQWVSTLREAGVPTRVLARLVREGFDDKWQKRQDEAQAAYMRGDMDVDGLGALSIEHDFEQEKTIRAALGEEDFRKWDMTNVLQSLNLRDIQLTDAEAGSLYELEKNHQRRLNELQLSKLKGQIDYATLEDQQAKAQVDHEVQLKALLGEQRFTTMRGVDDSAGELQRSLSDHPLPAEVPFESLLALQNQWSERRNDMAGRIQETRSQLSNFEEELKRMDDMREREFQRVLGTNVFNALERGQDARYKDLKRYADTWGLDDAGTDYLYRTIKYYEKAADDYQRQARALEAQGQDVDWDAVNKNVKQFAQQNEQALRNYLGDERFERIKSNEVFPFASAKKSQPSSE